MLILSMPKRANGVFISPAVKAGNSRLIIAATCAARSLRGEASCWQRAAASSMVGAAVAGRTNSARKNNATSDPRSPAVKIPGPNSLAIRELAPRGHPRSSRAMPITINPRQTSQYGICGEVRSLPSFMASYRRSGYLHESAEDSSTARSKGFATSKLPPTPAAAYNAMPANGSTGPRHAASGRRRLRRIGKCGRCGSLAPAPAEPSARRRLIIGVEQQRNRDDDRHQND